ncbi:hypothetical protein UFOVP413_34 [uncultured Caudovirales phage]|uniref:Uncharacterized protein n=1 Tax=uncultured Caudovirales phage TaxID=2100421 RepID=A0A6J5M365_9CAUD|nr:hypothetical protein UFOVP413_34 [uncultured Caudovirales phage]
MAIVLNSGYFLPTAKYGNAQNVSIGASSVQSTVIGTAGQTPNRLIRLCATTNCRIAIGTNPTASATSTLLPANAIEYCELTPGERFAVIQDSAAGTLSITECVL